MRSDPQNSATHDAWIALMRPRATSVINGLWCDSFRFVVLNAAKRSNHQRVSRLTRFQAGISDHLIDGSHTVAWARADIAVSEFKSELRVVETRDEAINELAELLIGNNAPIDRIYRDVVLCLSVWA